VGSLTPLGKSVQQEPRAAVSRVETACRVALLLAEVVALVLGCALLGNAHAAPAPAAAAGPATQLEDKPLPLRPRQQAGEHERDRNEAAALVGAARMLELNEQYKQALPLYQRAVRLDPQAEVILFHVIPLARALGRESEANRYAVLLSELKQDIEPLLPDHGQAEPILDDMRLRIELGRLYFLADRPDQAAKCFGRAFEVLSDPEKFGMKARSKRSLTAETCRLMGEAFLAAGRITEAQAAFEKANALAPDNALHGYYLAQVELKNNRPAEALARLDAYFTAKASGEGYAPYRLLGEILAKQNKSDDWMPRLIALHEKDAENEALGYFLAEQYRKKGAADKAAALYTALLKKSPAGEGYAGLLEIAKQKNDAVAAFDTLVAVQTKAGSLESVDVEVHALAQVPALVDAILARANSLKPADKNVAYAQIAAASEVALEAKRFEAAAGLIEQSNRLQPAHAVENLMRLGLAYQAAEKSDEAIAVYRKVLARKLSKNEQALARFGLAGALAQAGKIDEGLAEARLAAEASPDSIRIASREAWVLYIGKRYAEAGKAYELLLRRFGESYRNPETREVVREAKLLLSNVAVQTGRPLDAERWLEELLDEFPTDVSAGNDLGYLWVERGVHLERALRLIRRALDDEPKNVAYLDSLGWAYYQLGKYAEAVVELEKAAAGDTPDPVILDHLGDAYRKAGQPEKARQAWQRALERFKKDSEQDKAKKVESKLQAAGPPAGTSYHSVSAGPLPLGAGGRAANRYELPLD